MTGPAYHARTHRPGGTDPIPGLLLPTAGGDGVHDLILAESPIGLWKLDESSGTTAFDSSGNNNDMETRTNYLPPTWGQIAGPPGTQSAQFVPWIGGDEGSSVTVTLTALLDDFSAGVWVRIPAGALAQTSRLMGQGGWQLTNSWTLWFDGGNKFNASMGTANIAANNAASGDTWYLVGLTRESGTTTLYVNGLAQSATTATGPGTGSTNTWIGADGVGTTSGDNESGFMSWAFLTDTPISGADWLAIYEAGQTGGTLAGGLVWTSDGLGGASWEAPAGGVMPGARAYRGTNQSVADSTITIISFSAVSFDNDSLWSAGSPTRLTCTEDGIYEMNANGQWENNATGFRSIAIRLDGTTTIAVAQLGVASVAPGGGQACTTVCCHYELNAGQYIEFQVYQDNSTNVALNVLASTDFSPAMSMVKVSD